MNKTYNEDDKKVNNTKKNKELFITKINDKNIFKKPGSLNLIWTFKYVG